MDRLIKLLKNFQKLNTQDILIKIYTPDKFEKEVLDKNRIDQLYNEGVDSDGIVLPAYAASTVERKRRKGQPTDRVTLKDTGEFYGTFDLIFNSDLDFEIVAEDGEKGLFDRYGSKIVGWTNENKDEIIQDIQTKFIAEVQRIIFKGL